MEIVSVAFHGQTVDVHCPEIVARDLRRIFGRMDHSDASRRHVVRVIANPSTADYSISFNFDTASSFERLSQPDLAYILSDTIVRGLIYDMDDAVALHAGSVRLGESGILIPGVTGAGKSSLVAWLLNQGFEYLSDEIVGVVGDAPHLIGLCRALIAKRIAADRILEFPAFRNMDVIPGRDRSMFPPEALSVQLSAAPVACNLIVFPDFQNGAEIQISTMSPAETGLALFKSNLNARNLADGGFHAVTKLAKAAPAVRLKYGQFEQLGGTLDRLIELVAQGNLSSRELQRFILSLTRPVQASVGSARSEKYAIPAPTPLKEHKKLTVGMATYDDYDGVYFTLQSMRLHHPEILDQTEFLVVDNHPDGPCSKALKRLDRSIANYRYLPFQNGTGTAASRDAIFGEASGEFVVCMDCHVLVQSGALAKLLDYFMLHKDSTDLLQGPLLDDDLKTIQTHFEPVWREGMFGDWGTDERASDSGAPPFEILMQGLGLFACRRAAWPGFNPLFRGFGGEEGYLHQKFRNRGDRTLCLPFLRWLHRFHRPMGVPYRMVWEDRIRNYIIGFNEVGLPLEPMIDHFSEIVGGPRVEVLLDAVNADLNGQLADPRLPAKNPSRSPTMHPPG